MTATLLRTLALVLALLTSGILLPAGGSFSPVGEASAMGTSNTGRSAAP